MVQMKRVSTRELILALSGAILVLATLGAGSALAQGATPAAPAPAAPASAGAPGAPAVPAGVVPPPGYVIGPEDVLSVVFWREKDMSTDAAVTARRHDHGAAAQRYPRGGAHARISCGSAFRPPRRSSWKTRP